MEQGIEIAACEGLGAELGDRRLLPQTGVELGDGCLLASLGLDQGVDADQGDDHAVRAAAVPR